MTTPNDHPISDLLGTLLGFVLATLLPPAIWLCFDDMLAGLLGVPAIGSLEYWEAWGLFFVLGMIGRILFGRRG